MSTENLDLIRRAYEAFGRGDITTVLGVLDPMIHWHVPGRSPLSGDYKGHDEVIGFFAKTQELASGTFSIVINDMLANPQHVVVLCDVSAQRHGQHWSTPEVHVWRVANGHAVEFREYQDDQQAEDEFWSR
jgi:ketosteroid isomerase-like protein